MVREAAAELNESGQNPTSNVQYQALYFRPRSSSVQNGLVCFEIAPMPEPINLLCPFNTLQGIPADEWVWWIT